MNNEILITMNGVHFGIDNDKDNIETTSKGKYYHKNGIHYVLYEEILEGSQKVNKNTLKLSEGRVEVIRRVGSTGNNIYFEKDKRTTTIYNTPYGSLELAINTNGISVCETPDRLEVQIDYSLDINDQFASNCKMNIRIENTL